MAQKSGFFNALVNAGVYDRKYNANDYSDNLAVIISNGVLRSTNDDLKVTASGLLLTVGVGRGWIKGHYFNNTTAYTLPAVLPPTGGSRIDNVVLRFDNTITVRSISIEYVTGTAATNPVAPALTRNDNIYELCLAQITVQANANTVSVKDTRSNSNLCGWVYSVSGDGSFFTSLDNTFNEWFENAKDTLASVTLFKRYKYDTTLGAASSAVTFNIPQYDADTCFLEVYINGLLADNYTINGSVLRFGTTLIAGTEITVYCFKSIDGTGIMSVADEITQLQNDFATLDGVSKFVYTATGQDDNISLSQIAQAIYDGSYTAANVTAAANAFLTALGGNTWLASLYDWSQVTIEVVGKLNVRTPAYGSGTAQSRYRYFNLSQTSSSGKRIVFDFAKADTVIVSPTANTNSIIFYGTDLEIKNLSVDVEGDGAGVNVQVFAGSNIGRTFITDCRADVLASGDIKIAAHGVFTNCYFRARSEAGHSLLFCPDSEDLIRVIGGTYLAYAMLSGKTAAVFYTYGTQTNAVIMATNINCPTISVGGYWQQYLAVGYAGKTIIDGVTSTMNSTGGYNAITNQVWLSKAW